jgi:hypothetical protein
MDPHSDPVTLSATLATIAAFAEQCTRNRTALGLGFLRNAIRELRKAQAWRDARLAELGEPTRLPLVTDGDDGERIGAEALIYTLRYAAAETLQVLELCVLANARTDAMKATSPTPRRRRSK